MGRRMPRKPRTKPRAPKAKLENAASAAPPRQQQTGEQQPPDDSVFVAQALEMRMLPFLEMQSAMALPHFPTLAESCAAMERQLNFLKKGEIRTASEWARFLSYAMDAALVHGAGPRMMLWALVRDQRERHAAMVHRKHEEAASALRRKRRSPPASRPQRHDEASQASA